MRHGALVALSWLILPSAALKTHSALVATGEIAAQDFDGANPDCWLACGRQGGRCSFCGEGACCRHGFSRNPDECRGAQYIQLTRHECVSIQKDEDSWALSNLSALKVEKAVYRSTINADLAKDVTDTVNNLLHTHGPLNLTGMKDLNPVFGDVAPREAKILRVSVGSKFRDLKELAAGGPPNKQYDISTLFKEDPPVRTPSIFISVFSRRATSTRRGLVRNMWKEVANSGPSITVKFTLCDMQDENTLELLEENSAFNDLLFLPCTESYGQGALTLKVLSAMEYFRQRTDHSLFMKVDDDTFVAWSKFSNLLAKSTKRYSYIGVPIDAGIPCRNSSFRWYEPYTTFNGTYFPRGMAGGPGYTFSRGLVEEILDSGVGHQNVLWNEDRAAGVWVDKLLKKASSRAGEQGKQIEFVDVPGIDGWWKWDWHHPMKNWATWADYPHMLHHGLHGESIACLAVADKASDPWRPISRCFAVEIGEHHEALVCARQTEVKLAR